MREQLTMSCWISLFLFSWVVLWPFPPLFQRLLLVFSWIYSFQFPVEIQITLIFLTAVKVSERLTPLVEKTIKKQQENWPKPQGATISWAKQLVPISPMTGCNQVPITESFLYPW